MTAARPPPDHRRRLGRRGERVAARHLRRRGLRVLVRNLRIGRGELDIVARDGETLVLVEVRSRLESPHSSAYPALGRRKLERLRRAARAYLAALGWRPRSWRVDAVEVRFRRRWLRWSVVELRWHEAVVDPGPW